ncbi:transcriptional regulator, TetR family [Secundilactobacillus odoratitofui DSM 19909 = JCM 15043]|uniref:Transcriptional regulator, TetR family n=1 Tax=Secundilactobacillus odoratitofui DSM 19909 = JCM 15043 TaxID=1423776 RepID=A0A0R1LNB5_9LACO|nr:TetR/AcrR family transcriptional regulator [Secundilactobacillus odoratitofui]KRK97349.1 transcriptional regulator, TetR family [Secundilactobacillus odoratitofui DSM 19909 = JCM 15043]
MKYDLSRQPTKGAQRTLSAFSSAMFDLLELESFETISVNEICERCDYPRATFYNYFDDKYDLVNYCWYLLATEIRVDEAPQLSPNEILVTYFDRLYQFFDHHKRQMKAILKHNQVDETLVASFTNYLKQTVRKIFRQIFAGLQLNIPAELLVTQCSATLLNLIEWIFLQDEPTTLEEAHRYLSILIGNSKKVVMPGLVQSID